MGLYLPEDIRVLSKDFQSHYRSVCEEVIRIATFSNDIERLRAIVDTRKNLNNLVFFRITGYAATDPDSAPSSNCETDDEGLITPVWNPSSHGADCDEGQFSAIEYKGSIFRVQSSNPQDGPGGFNTGTNPSPPCQKMIASAAFGFDLSVAENQPCRMPDGIEAQPQILSVGTVVSGTMIGPKTVVFCSNMPRLSADCS